MYPQGTPRRKKSSGELNRRQPIPKIRRGSSEGKRRSASPTPSSKAKDESVQRPRRSVSHEPTTPIIIWHNGEDTVMHEDKSSQELLPSGNQHFFVFSSSTLYVYYTLPRRFGH